jgi:large subunit ribosomal protein L23
MSVLKKPLVTEKMTLLGEKSGEKQYGFVVNIESSKPEIKTAIEKMYNVQVKSLRTMVYAGKKRSRYSRAGVIMGKSSNFKKAIITLAEGQEIDFYKNI